MKHWSVVELHHIENAGSAGRSGGQSGPRARIVNSHCIVNPCDRGWGQQWWCGLKMSCSPTGERDGSRNGISALMRGFDSGNRGLAAGMRGREDTCSYQSSHYE